MRKNFKRKQKDFDGRRTEWQFSRERDALVILDFFVVIVFIVYLIVNIIFNNGIKRFTEMVNTTYCPGL